MSITICTHAWAEKYEIYAHHLRIHLSALVLSKPEVPFQVDIYKSKTDKAVGDVVDAFRGLIPMTIVEQEPTILGRRCIGRNISALDCDTDLIWYADADFIFGPGCLDALWAYWRGLSDEEQGSASLIWPKSCYFHTDRSVGDLDSILACTNSRDGLARFKPEQSELHTKTYSRAIGGIQISSRPFALKHGYLNDFPEWQTPLDPPFIHTKDDVAYRKLCERNGTVHGIQLPQLYRIRHTDTTHHG